MNALDRKHFHELLSARIEILQQDIVNLEALVAPIAPDAAIGRLSRMEAIAEKGVNETNLLSSRHQLQRLQQAVERVDTPDYGICMECGETIPRARLELMPDSTACVACLEKLQSNPDRDR